MINTADSRSAQLRDMLTSGRAKHSLEGRRFGRLVVLSRDPGKHDYTRWRCVCDCGRECVALQASLISHRKSSCGCRRTGRNARDTGSASARVLRVEYDLWKGIRRRCTDPLDPQFRFYGGRGTRMCKRWLDGEAGASGFECFVHDISTLPGSGSTIDRIDKARDFEPGNVKWAPALGESNPRQHNRHLSAAGRTMSLVEWCKELGIPYGRTYQRLLKGWSVPQALGLETRSGATKGRPKGRKDSSPRKNRQLSVRPETPGLPHP